MCNPMGLESEILCASNASCHVRDDKSVQDPGEILKVFCPLVINLQCND